MVTSILSMNVYSFFQQYRKLSQSYYPLLECLTQDHMSFITSLEPRVLIYILTSISEGLTAVGKNYLYSAKERIQVFSHLGFSEKHVHLYLKKN